MIKLSTRIPVLETWPCLSARRLVRATPARIQWRTLLAGASLFGLFALFLAAVQFATPSLAGNDGYYHIKLAYLMRTEGLRPAFTWLPLTVLNAREFVDHHFLYHVLLTPFTSGDLRLGAKWASVIFPALSFLAVWWLLRGQGVPHAWLWSLGLLAVSEAFIYRMSMPRAQSLSLGVLVLALHWLLTERHGRLLPLAFVYVWLYNAFPLILMVAALYAAARWLGEGRLAWRPLVYAGLGIGLGLVINPYFPDNLTFIYRHLGPKLVDATATSVGSEWYPYNTAQLLEHSGGALVAFLAGVLALSLNDRRLDTRTAAGFFLSLLFGAMLFQSRRFVEYFPAFALLFAAFAWAPLLRRWLASSPVAREGETPRARRAAALAALLVALLAPAVTFTLGAARASLEDSKPHERYAAASGWLADNTPAGARIFQTDWDDFPRLFFYNTHNTYTLGLDPTYMQLYDAELYDLWVDISKGRVERPSAAIRSEFAAAYVLTDLKHTAFLREAGDDPNMEEVYRDDYAAVLRVTRPAQDAQEVTPAE
jgi:hypothetical protein